MTKDAEMLPAAEPDATIALLANQVARQRAQIDAVRAVCAELRREADLLDGPTASWPEWAADAEYCPAPEAVLRLAADRIEAALGGGEDE